MVTKSRKLPTRPSAGCTVVSSLKRQYILSVHTFADVPVTVPGAGEGGAASEALPASSAVGLAATAGAAGPGVGWEEGVAVPLVAFLRAPGGTYALAPRTTAEYLRGEVSLSRYEQFMPYTCLPRQCRRQDLHSSDAPPQYGDCWLPTSIIPLSETLAESGVAQLTRLISSAICWALRSRSLKSGALRSNLVV